MHRQCGCTCRSPISRFSNQYSTRTLIDRPVETQHADQRHRVDQKSESRCAPQPRRRLRHVFRQPAQRCSGVHDGPSPPRSPAPVNGSAQRRASGAAMHPLPWPRIRTAPNTVPHAHLDLDKPTGDSVKTTTCYMCACRCGIRVHHEGRPRPLHRRQPDASGQPRRDLREGLGRHHAALFAGAAFQAAAARRRARRRRIPRDRMGRGARARDEVARRHPQRATPTSSRSSPAATSRRR